MSPKVSYQVQICKYDIVNFIYRNNYKKNKKKCTNLHNFASFENVSILYFQPKEKKGSREASEVASFFVFSHIRRMGYFRLGWVKVNEGPAGARNRRKATVKIRRNPPLRILPLIHVKGTEYDITHGLRIRLL